MLCRDVFILDFQIPRNMPFSDNLKNENDVKIYLNMLEFANTLLTP